MTFWTAFLTKKQAAARPVALDYLRSQVFRADCAAIHALDRNVFAVRPLADGLVEALVEDLGGHERVLRWDVVRAFGKSDDELFALARTQAAASACNITPMEVGGGVQVLASNELYLSARLLDNFARSKHRHGVLFAPISWHHWCIHVVQQITVPHTVALISLVAADVNRHQTSGRQTSGRMKVGDFESLTGDLYWYKPTGVIETLELVGEGADRRATSREFARAIA